MTTFEVEIKFRVRDTADLERRLQQQFGSTRFGETVTEFDSFFQHPCRNFVQTDECLRLRSRTEPDGNNQYSLTYKGPKIDTSTKTRQEIEIPIIEPEHWESLLTVLGFYKTASVCKHRRRTALTIGHRRVEIVLDTLPALPESSRLFVELETFAGAEEVEECRLLLLGIAERLKLNEPIRDSYLKLVQDNG